MTRSGPPSSPPCPAPACTNATEPRPKPEQAPGVLYSEPAGVEIGRFSPSTQLAASVEHFWWVRWDVTQPRVSEVLSYPCVHVVFENDEPRIVGIVRARFSRCIEGRGRVFAIKFQPGMFRALHGAPAWQLTDRVVPLAAELGRAACDIARDLWSAPTELERAKLLERHLCAATPAPDADAVLARDLVNRVRAERALRNVATLAAESGLGARSLQRLFREYVGVGPKWVLRRFRLQEAAERLKAGDDTVASVAASLDYFDQAHFARDFKAVVGFAPIDYIRKFHQTE